MRLGRKSPGDFRRQKDISGIARILGRVQRQFVDLAAR